MHFSIGDVSMEMRRRIGRERRSSLQKPASNNPPLIAYHHYYYCDSFIDCGNFSDESKNGCATNDLIIFVIFEVIGSLLILTSQIGRAHV